MSCLVLVHLVCCRQIYAHIQSDFHDPTAGSLEWLPAVSGSDATGLSDGQLGIT